MTIQGNSKLVRVRLQKNTSYYFKRNYLHCVVGKATIMMKAIQACSKNNNNNKKQQFISLIQFPVVITICMLNRFRVLMMTSCRLIIVVGSYLLHDHQYYYPVNKKAFLSAIVDHLDHYYDHDYD